MTSRGIELKATALRALSLTSRINTSSPLLVLALVTFEVVALGIFTSQSYFFYDDFIHLRVAQREGLSAGYLGQAVMDHFAPGHRLATWFVQTFFPMNFAVAQVILLACFAGSAFLLYLVLVDLFGRGPGPLVLTFLYGTSVVHVDVAQWWSSGLHSLPSSLLSLLAIFLYLRFYRSGSLRLLGLSVLAFVAALLFCIKPLLVPLYLLLLRVLVLGRGWPLRESAAAAVREWRVWAVYLLPAAPYLGVYLTQYWDPSGFPTLSVLVDYVATAWARVFSPSFFGFHVPADASAADDVAVVLVQLALVGLVALSIVRNPSAWRAWVFFAIAFLANVLLVGLGRINLFGPDIAYAPRYYVEPTYLLALALGAAFLRPAAPMVAAREWLEDVRAEWQGSGWALVGLVAAAHLAFAWGSAAEIMDRSPGPRARSYMENVIQGIRQAARPGQELAMVDGALPEYVMGPWLLWGAPHLYNRYSWVFPLIHARLVFDVPSPNLHAVTPEGKVRQVAFAPRRGGDARELLKKDTLTVTRGDVEDGEYGVCVEATAESALTELTVTPPLLDGDWFLRLDYSSLLRQTLPLFVDRGSGYPWLDRAVTLHSGRSRAVLANLGGPVEKLRFDIPPRSLACLDRVEVGALVPWDEAST